MISKSKLSILNAINQFMSDDFLFGNVDLIEKWHSGETQKRVGLMLGLKQREVVQGPHRNISAYLFFCESRRREILETNPGIKPNKVMILFGESWRNLSDQEKQPFIDKAMVDRERYNKYLESKVRPKKNARPSIYNLFCTDERRAIKKDHPDMNASDVRRELGKRWKAVKETNPDLLKEKYGYVIEESQDVVGNL